MHRCTKIYLGTAIAAITLTTPDLAIAEDELSRFHFKKGIWGITLDRQIQGQERLHIPESLTSCHDPAAMIREGTLAAQKEGCTVKLVSHSATEIRYDISCIPALGLSENTQIFIETSSPEKVTFTTTSKEARTVMASRWVKACP